MDRTIQSGSYLVFVLARETPPAVYSINEVPEKNIEINGRVFADAGLGDWIGFYDWLRHKSGKVLGVRLWPDAENAHILAIGACMNAVVAKGGKELFIYFGAEHEFEPTMSDDQDFGGNRIFARAGSYAITFNAPMAR